MKALKTQNLIWLCLVMALSSCGNKEREALKLADEDAALETVEVKTVSVEPRMIPRYLRVIGELIGRVDSKVAADGSGRVTEVMVERGTVVKKGDVLIRLDDRAARLALREAEAQLAQSRARLKLAEAEWKRNEPLAKNKAIAEADFERLTTDLESARADESMAVVRLETAKKNVSDLEVKAPFDGVVAERMVDVGEFVASGREVLQLVSAGNLRLLLQLPETAVGKVKTGQEIRFQVPAYKDEEFVGKVSHIGAVVREATRDMLIEADVTNEHGRLKQGMFAEGRLMIGEESGLAIPSAAVKRDATGARVLVVKDGIIEERLVDTGDTLDGWTEIVNGLDKDTLVVVEAGSGAVDGARIKLTSVN